MPEREEQRQPTPEDARPPTAETVAELPPATIISTTLCVEEVDKDGRRLRSFCVTLPGAYPVSSGAPTTTKEDSLSDGGPAKK
jgi:hypothetical protein